MRQKYPGGPSADADEAETDGQDSQLHSLLEQLNREFDATVTSFSPLRNHLLSSRRRRPAWRPASTALRSGRCPSPRSAIVAIHDLAVQRTEGCVEDTSRPGVCSILTDAAAMHQLYLQGSATTW